MQTVYFTPGPSQTHPRFSEFMNRALKERVPSISHRSKDFEAIFAGTAAKVREALVVPGEYSVFFVSSATEAWERFTQSVVHKSSHHFVNGAFSKGWFESAVKLGKKPTRTDAPEGFGFSGKVEIPSEAEIVAITHCETSTGAFTSAEFIESLREQSNDALVAVDIVSTAPIVGFNFNKVDCAFFSVQKCCGLPAGLGVMIVSPRALERAKLLKEGAFTLGSYHDLCALAEFAAKNQTPCTPNVLGIYLLGEVLGDFLNIGISQIQTRLLKRIESARAVLLRSALFTAQSPNEFQAPTVLVLKTSKPASEIRAKLLADGLAIGEGYGERKERMIRVANFPSTGDQEFERVILSLAKIT